MIELIRNGFRKECEMLAESDRPGSRKYIIETSAFDKSNRVLLCKSDCDVVLGSGTLCKTFTKPKTIAFAADGEPSWYLGDTACVIAVPTWKTAKCLTAYGVARKVRKMLYFWKNKYHHMMKSKDVFHCFHPQLLIERKWWGYNVAMKMTTFSGRFID